MAMSGHFMERLRRCEACPRRCGIDRLKGETSYCRTAAEVLVAHSGLHYGEEPPISGRRGSGTIFFAGCNLRCVFCQNWQISQRFSRETVTPLTPAELAEEMLYLQEKGAHNINFVSPSHVVWQVAEAILLARRQGLVIPIVYNSGGYDAPEAIRALRGLVEIYMPDIKYMENEPARIYSGAADYPDVVVEVLQEMYEQVGPLQTDGEGIARRGLLVRHLVLPGLTDNSRRCLETVAAISTRIPVSLMSQYSPRHRARQYPEIARTLHQEEYHPLVDYALELGFETLYTQDISSTDHYLPDFDRENPFET